MMQTEPTNKITNEQKDQALLKGLSNDFGSEDFHLKNLTNQAIDDSNTMTYKLLNIIFQSSKADETAKDNSCRHNFQAPTLSSLTIWGLLGRGAPCGIPICHVAAILGREFLHGFYE